MHCMYWYSAEQVHGSSVMHLINLFKQSKCAFRCALYRDLCWRAASAVKLLESKAQLF